MKLTVAERLTLLDILPKEGDYTTLKIMRKLRETLSFSEAEHKALNFREAANMVTWDITKDLLKDVVIGEKATDIIEVALKDLDTNKKLQDRHFSLYEKFVVENK